MPIYSFGADSPLKFELSEEFAEAYNRATKAFFEAQTRYKEENGTRWEPDQPLTITTSKKDLDAFNSFGTILEEAIERYGKAVHEDELTDDYLIKN